MAYPVILSKWNRHRFHFRVRMIRVHSDDRIAAFDYVRISDRITVPCRIRWTASKRNPDEETATTIRLAALCLFFGAIQIYPAIENAVVNAGHYFFPHARAISVRTHTPNLPVTSSVKPSRQTIPLSAMHQQLAHPLTYVKGILTQIRTYRLPGPDTSVRPLQDRRTLAIAQSHMDSADMGRKRWAHVSKSERSRLMRELAQRPRGKDKTVEEPEMPKFTWRNG